MYTAMTLQALINLPVALPVFTCTESRLKIGVEDLRILTQGFWFLALILIPYLSFSKHRSKSILVLWAKERSSLSPSSLQCS